MKSRILIALLLCAGTLSVAAQTQVPEELAAGLQAFQAGEFEQALARFEAARARDDIAAWDGHSLFWSARTRMALGRYESAADTFDRFLSQYTRHPYREEASYQRARIFYIQDRHEAAIDRFTGFFNEYPDSEFYPNALYWTGEALFALGRLDEARRLFAEVTERYPASFRVEAARYRLDIIELSRREEELLTLLQWSHEEYLSALETYQARERSYQEALRAYRERFAGLASEDFEQEIRTLNARIAELETTVAERDTRINDLLSQLRQASVEPDAGDPPRQAPRSAPEPQSDVELQETLLSLKAQALELQEILLEQREATE
ncbi:MAG TPA: tetratricopeptide repeat protein [Spirochaetia bacterium]|nr:tetratricopeptide repeat protein [Spirochaetia bacterium]